MVGSVAQRSVKSQPPTQAKMSPFFGREVDITVDDTDSFLHIIRKLPLHLFQKV
jgi:hypothetical protein